MLESPPFLKASADEKGKKNVAVSNRSGVLFF